MEFILSEKKTILEIFLDHPNNFLIFLQVISDKPDLTISSIFTKTVLDKIIEKGEILKGSLAIENNPDLIQATNRILARLDQISNRTPPSTPSHCPDSLFRKQSPAPQEEQPEKQPVLDP